MKVLNVQFDSRLLQPTVNNILYLSKITVPPGLLGDRGGIDKGG